MSDYTYKRCSCGKEFFIKDVDRDFYIAKGLDLPIRCFDCRKARSTVKLAKALSAVYKKK